MQWLQQDANWRPLQTRSIGITASLNVVFDQRRESLIDDSHNAAAQRKTVFVPLFPQSRLAARRKTHEAKLKRVVCGVKSFSHWTSTGAAFRGPRQTSGTMQRSVLSRSSSSSDHFAFFSFFFKQKPCMSLRQALPAIGITP